MLIQRGPHFEMWCDVCGASEVIDAKSHAEAWEKMKRFAWVVRKGNATIMHVCPECPANPSPEGHEARL